MAIQRMPTMSFENSATHHGPPKTYVRIKLECGHWIKARNEPFTPRILYGCTNGQSCGYRLRWTECMNLDGTRRKENDSD